MLLEKLFDGAISYTAKLTGQGALEEEGLAEDFGQGEDELDIIAVWKNLLHHSLCPGDGLALSATRT